MTESTAILDISKKANSQDNYNEPNIYIDFSKINENTFTVKYHYIVSDSINISKVIERSGMNIQIYWSDDTSNPLKYKDTININRH